MNTLLLSTEVQNFIDNNINTDINRLLFKGSPFEGITVQELANQIISKKKSEKKLPSWFETVAIFYPPKLSIEQTSSEITANYKSSLIQGNSMIDITGGFGIDCFYFSKKNEKVIHCEMNADLSNIAKYNFEQLGVNNIETIPHDGLTYLKESQENFDGIYIDPSRRSDAKGKVFLLKDCAPNVPDNLDFLFTKSNTILIKNSPILDISATLKELQFVKEIHIVAVKNEVKELLFLLEKDFNGDLEIKTINIKKNGNENYTLKLNDKSEVKFGEPLTYLYEPNSAILKAGAFDQIGNSYGLIKLHQHSHLYTSNEKIINFPGRIFKIQNSFEYNKKKSKKEINSDKANITTRNFPKTVEQLRKELKLKDGGDRYIFFTTNINNKLIVIDCKKIII
ncbi:hypothetical protein SAMN04489761_0958 [Tenacibaculum sp. MAR_2009_124]|uniref:class I SAM-dependent methyltransferase n=1 Tax=Tenacibaculum sp. MAR_2009_124 TaxID=1250059 RepID=UPI00089D322C|nr:class I SAM-dependent methyltransferase [Tenacibaculum sp. MAR_2009_124]SEB47995.1 hypothetical protein SAMN04489761_0958 [Tenacibaculum sp. MAR_2009_124]